MVENNQSFFADKQLLFDKLGCHGNMILRKGFQVPKSAFRINNFKITCFGFSVVVILFTISSNAVFIYGLKKTNKTLSYIQKLFIYLSCVDILPACVPVPMFAVYFLNGSSCLYMSIMMSFGTAFLITDSAILFTISLLRFYSIANPLKRINYELVTISVILESLLSIIIAGKVFFNYRTANTISDLEEVMYLSGVVILSINTLTIFCVSFCFAVIKRKTNLIGTDTNIQTFDRIQIQQHKRSTISLLIMALLMTMLMAVQGIGYVILIIRTRMGLVSFEKYIFTLNVTDILVLCCTLNPGLNSMIYIGRCKKLKQFYWKMVKCE